MSTKIMKTCYSLSLVVLCSFYQPVYAGDATAGKAKAALCAGCHGSNGISPSEDVPNLAGQKAAYLVKATKDYKTGARKNPMMQSIIGGVPDADIEDIAAYYSSLK